MKIYTHWPRGKRGFSLVETVLALGVMSFGFIPLVMLMPVGLDVVRDSLQTTVRTDIMRQLSSNFQETPFQKISNRDQMAYYSEEGALVDDPKAFLAVTWEVLPDTALLTETTGTEANPSQGYLNSNLKTVKVHFYTRADRANTSLRASETQVLYVPSGNN